MGDVYSLIERAHRGDKEARDTLVYENTGLVWSVVRRFSYSGADREELFQIGVIGLLKAIDRFDPSFQVNTFRKTGKVGEWNNTCCPRTGDSSVQLDEVYRYQPEGFGGERAGNSDS